MKKKKKKLMKQNQGNSFIMVVATISFLAVLVAAILVAVALCYRLKAYDINARDNFYYLEQAMDEIYAGVGADAMRHLNEAYDDTIEVLVYFDSKTQSYVTMDNDKANDLLKNTYMKLVKEDENYKTPTTVAEHLKSFLSNKYDESDNKEGIQLSLSTVGYNTDDVTITNLILKREATYSTVNTRKKVDDDGNVNAAQGDTFVQTITTDLIIGKPEFNVNFNTIASELSDLYPFAIVADKGVEIGNATSKVNITGNIYAAADFYNKDYNENPSTEAEEEEKSGTVSKPQKIAVSSYDKDSTEYKDCDGKKQKSMYSGLYIDGADVIISAERIIVPGSIAAFNSANLIVIGSNQSALSTAEVWADGIVLGGYSLASTATDDDSVKGAEVSMRAKAYISDDLELNATASQFSMVGQYYGYNYASLDNRTYTDACIKANGGRIYTSAVPDTIADGATIDGQAHYNSSAVIVNGEDSSLDLSGISSMYIAGQSYIEMSKYSDDDKAEEIEVTNKNGETEKVTQENYDYPEMGTRTETVTTTKTDSEGNVEETTKNVKVPDNYTTNSKDVKDPDKNTNIQDYRTGEAISVKSNQLAYIPTQYVTDTEDGLYVSLPASLQNKKIFKDNWQVLSQIPVIKTVISGKKYYFFDFSTDSTYDDGTKKGKASDVMNEFIAGYADLFNLKDGETMSEGEIANLTDITDYDYFQIEMLKVNDAKVSAKKSTGEEDENNWNYKNIYSNSAISVKDGAKLTIKAKSSSIDPLIAAANNINSDIDEQVKYIEDQKEKDTKSAEKLSVDEDQDGLQLANSVTTKLQSQYKEVKWTLTTKSRNQQAVTDAHSMKESEITPINYFFNFGKLKNSWKDVNVKLKSGYRVWVSDEDVEVTDKGDVKGLIICKGDVTFSSDVDSFEGLIVSGSKVKVDKSMNFSANEEIIKSILRECDESQLYQESDNYFRVCELFKQYQSIYKPETNSGEVATESTKSISAVQFEDVLSFNNWKKNVD